MPLLRCRLPLAVSQLIPNNLERQLHLWLRMTVKIWDLRIRGKARVTLRPVSLLLGCLLLPSPGTCAMK